MRNKKISALLLAASMLISLVVPVSATAETTVLTANEITDAVKTAVEADLGKTIKSDSSLSVPTLSDCTGETNSEFSSPFNVSGYKKFLQSGDTTGNGLFNGAIFPTLWTEGAWPGAINTGLVMDFGRAHDVDAVTFWSFENEMNNGSGPAVENYNWEDYNKPTYYRGVRISTSEDGETWTKQYLDDNGYVATEDTITYSADAGKVAKIYHRHYCPFTATVKARYVKVEFAAQNQFRPAEIMAFGTPSEVTREPQTLYSVTGYDVPSDLQTLLKANDNITVATATSNVNTTSAEVIAASKTEDMADNLPTENEKTTTFPGLFKRTGKEDKVQVAWYDKGNTRYMVIDLKSEQSVKLLGLYYAGKGQWESGNINTIELATGDSAEGPWDTVLKNTKAETNPVYTTGSTETKNLTQFFLKKLELDEAVSTRYLRVKFTYNNNVGLGRMIILGEEAPTWTPSYGNKLTLISNNRSIGSLALPNATDVPLLDDVTVDGITTNARYKILSGGFTDETARDADGYVASDPERDSSPEPDLQDSRWNDGNTGANSEPWETSNGAVLWDLGTTATVDRLDIISMADGEDDDYKHLKGAKISVSTDGENFTTVIDKYNSGMNVAKVGMSQGKYSSFAIFDLGGVKARYIKVEMKSSAYQILLGEMYIYGKVDTSASDIGFFDSEGENFDYENYSVGLKADVTFAGGEGTLVVGMYDADMKNLKKVWTATGAGKVSIDLSEIEESINESNTDVLKAFAFKSLSDGSSLIDAASFSMTSGK